MTHNADFIGISPLINFRVNRGGHKLNNVLGFYSSYLHYNTSLLVQVDNVLF